MKSSDNNQEGSEEVEECRTSSKKYTAVWDYSQHATKYIQGKKRLNLALSAQSRWHNRESAFAFFKD